MAPGSKRCALVLLGLGVLAAACSESTPRAPLLRAINPAIGPNDATTNLQIMAYQYSFQWYQMGKGMAQAIVLLLLVVMVSYLLVRLWNRASESAQ